MRFVRYLVFLEEYFSLIYFLSLIPIIDVIYIVCDIFESVIHWFQEVKELARPGFIVDDIDDYAIDETVAEEESDEEDELFDSVCSFCDNGGELLW
jgi:hypothetical protein